jgi:hypothetical protein
MRSFRMETTPPSLMAGKSIPTDYPAPSGHDRGQGPGHGADARGSSAGHTTELLLEPLFDLAWYMDGELIPITKKPGEQAWIHRPPEQCANGHPRTPASGSYAEGWFACGCSGAHLAATMRGRGTTHVQCTTCGAVTLVPACTNPTLKVGWVASHGG